MLHTFPFLAAILIMASAPAVAADEPLIGLITKTETNPFFVKMREGALQSAQVLGARLMTDAGRRDGDNAGQVTALENMIAAGAKAILITPSDSKAIVPSIRKARAKGILVIALDSPTDPPDASDAVFATDNYRAGVLIGRYARSALAGKPLRIVMLDLFPGHPVGAQRHNGFLEGLGLPARVPAAPNSFGILRCCAWRTVMAISPEPRRRWRTAWRGASWTRPRSSTR